MEPRRGWPRLRARSSVDPRIQPTGRTPHPPGILRVLRRELSDLAHSRTPVLLMLVLPLLSFGLLWAIFSQGTPSDLPVAVCDLDGSSLSRRLVRMIDATPSMEVAFRVTTPAEGERLLERGKSYALILLPKDLEHDGARGRAPAVVGYTNAQWILPASLIGRELRAVTTAAADRSQLEPIRIHTVALFNPQLNYLFYLVTALLPTMLQIFIAVLAVHVVGRELKEGSAGDWLVAAGGSAARAVIGKFLPYTVGFTLIGLFMITLVYRYLGTPLRGSATTIVLGTLLFVLAYQTMGLLIIVWARSLRLGTSAVAFYTSPAFAFVGTTFPTMAMPAFAQAWGALLPLSHYLRLLVEQGSRGARWSASVPELFALLAFVVIATACALPRLKRVGPDPESWGRS